MCIRGKTRVRSLVWVFFSQDKCYPRDWLVRGRLRVKLSDDNGKPLVSEIPGSRSKDPFMVRSS